MASVRNVIASLMFSRQGFHTLLLEDGMTKRKVGESLTFLPLKLQFVGGFKLRAV